MDPIEKLADHGLRELAADVQVQLEKGTGTRPLLWLLASTRARAAKAIVLFMDADPEDGKLMRRLQGEVRLYDDLVASCRLLVSEGKQADQRITESDRSDLEDVVMQMTPEQRQLYQLEQRGND